VFGRSKVRSMKISEAKVVWFMLRTGCERHEAMKWLSSSNNRIEVAIRLRNSHREAIHQESVRALKKPSVLHDQNQ
jgi:hypothetical protein